jgi:hypothetical protein
MDIVRENSLNQKDYSYVFVAKSIIENNFLNRQATQAMWAVVTKLKSLICIYVLNMNRFPFTSNLTKNNLKSTNPSDLHHVV